MLANRQGRVIIGTLQSSLVGVVVREADLRPALSVLNNRQWRYGLRLLAAPKTQSTRDILPLILQEGKEQSQSWEQSVDNITWKRPSKARQKGLGQ